jgi:hypothetical protein
MVADIHQLTNDMLPELKDKLIAYLTAHPELADKLDVKK